MPSPWSLLTPHPVDVPEPLEAQQTLHRSHSRGGEPSREMPPPCLPGEAVAPDRPPAWHLTTTRPRCHPSPRLATAEAPDAMEEWDVPQMKKEVESLKHQLAFNREVSSKTIPELIKWIEDGIPKDPFLNPDLMKNNPWVEKGKCAIL
ncbi:Guanine nucleotide-binding protein G(I)/G(S)/G(O) subunit gamma-13 [Manis javanica]|nr:Guanine nucleotide-binding protein G(I)/G(S)/G(O) subunit gamma-13 [Manis javanica]